MLFNLFIEGFEHLQNYFSAERQLLLWQACMKVLTVQPLWRPEFAYSRDAHQALVTPYALENTNCGKYGWLSDAEGVRYSNRNRNGQPWTAIPDEFLAVVADLKKEKIIPPSFIAENCLINKYQDQREESGKIKPSRLGLHRDKSERNLVQPVISISLGLAAIFQIGGLEKADAVQEVTVTSGDLVILGGQSRNAYHAVKCVLPNTAPKFLPAHDYRLNITIRQVD